MDKSNERDCKEPQKPVHLYYIYKNYFRHGYELDNKLAALNFRKQFKILNTLYPGYGFSIGIILLLNFFTSI